MLRCMCWSGRLTAYRPSCRRRPTGGRHWSSSWSGRCGAWPVRSRRWLRWGAIPGCSRPHGAFRRASCLPGPSPGLPSSRRNSRACKLSLHHLPSHLSSHSRHRHLWQLRQPGMGHTGEVVAAQEYLSNLVHECPDQELPCLC